MTPVSCTAQSAAVLSPTMVLVIVDDPAVDTRPEPVLAVIVVFTMSAVPADETPVALPLTVVLTRSKFAPAQTAMPLVSLPDTVDRWTVMFLEPHSEIPVAFPLT